MVVLVRCKNETFSVALESCLEGLVKGGLIAAYLDKGEWITVPDVIRTRRISATRFTTLDWVASAAA